MKQMNYKLLSSIFLPAILFTGCTTQNSEKNPNQLNFPDIKIPEKYQKQFEEQFYSIQEKIEKIISQASDHKGNKLINLRAPVAFHRVDSNAGFFYLTVESINQHTDGYRLKLKIGNPLAADFGDVILKMKWAGMNKQTPIEKTVKIFGELPSSTWKSIEVNLSPVNSEDDLEKLQMEIVANQVQMLK